MTRMHQKQLSMQMLWVSTTLYFVLLGTPCLAGNEYASKLLSRTMGACSYLLSKLKPGQPPIEKRFPQSRIDTAEELSKENIFDFSNQTEKDPVSDFGYVQLHYDSLPENLLGQFVLVRSVVWGYFNSIPAQRTLEIFGIVLKVTPTHVFVGIDKYVPNIEKTSISKISKIIKVPLTVPNHATSKPRLYFAINDSTFNNTQE